MGFFSAIKRMMRNEIAADVSQNNGFDKLAEWWGIDQAKPKAINETTYFTCLKVLSETMGKMPLKFYQEDESGGRVRAPTNDAADMLMHRPNPFMSPATFWSVLEANCEHYGNAYVWIQTTYELPSLKKIIDQLEKMAEVISEMKIAGEKYMNGK